MDQILTDCNSRSTGCDDDASLAPKLKELSGIDSSAMARYRERVLRLPNMIGNKQPSMTARYFRKTYCASIAFE